MSDIAISVHNLGKRYAIRARQRKPTTLMNAVRQTLTSPFTYLQSTLRPPSEEETLWALRHVSFEVKEGDIVGIIGRNGAGKSTLLKILSRITKPTEGEARIRGRVGSLIEVGTGFHPELTGRENVYLNGTILGMRRHEISEQFDAIVDFAGVDKFIDTPVKFYSSGMFVRLGFAVAAHLQPDILMVDEVLSVGDAEFQKKSIGRMESVAKQGRTVFFVSHNMATIENLCHRVIVMKGGRVDFDGATRAGIASYISQLSSQSYLYGSLENAPERSGSGEVIITSFRVEDAEGHPIDYIPSGYAVDFVFGYQVKTTTPLDQVIPSFAIKNVYGSSLILHRSNFTAQVFDQITGRGEFRCSLPRLPLTAGTYVIDGNIEVKGSVADDLTVGEIQVIEGDFFGTGSKGFPSHSPILMDGNWCQQSEQLAPRAILG